MTQPLPHRVPGASRHAPSEVCDCPNPRPGKPFHCAAVRTEPAATDHEVWRRLAVPVVEGIVPDPCSIYLGEYLGIVRLRTLVDLTAWADWLGCGPLAVEVFETGQPGLLGRDTTAETIWQGRTIRVKVSETFPAIEAAVAEAALTPDVALVGV